MSRKNGASDAWHIDLSNWTTMEPILKWNKAAQTGNYDALVETLTEVVKAWEFDSDPGKVDSYRQLPPDKFPMVLRQMGAAITKLFRDEEG